jgi:hypothetical protein
MVMSFGIEGKIEGLDQVTIRIPLGFALQGALRRRAEQRG